MPVTPMSGEPRMQSRRIRWVVGGSSVLLLAFLGTAVEWVEQPIDLGYGTQALQNPLLAAELHLEAEGIEAESVNGLAILDALPPSGDVLIMTASRRAMSEARASALEAWVWSGGHLVVVAEGPYDMDADENPDDLMDRFGFYLRDCSTSDDDAVDSLERFFGTGEPEPSPAPDDDQDQGVAASEDAEDDENTIEIGELIRNELSAELPACRDELEKTAVLLDRDRYVEVELSSCQGIYAYGDEIPDDDSETVSQIMGRPFGAGSFTAASSLSILTNRRIHCADHAYLLEWLARRGGKTWLLADPDIPTLASLVWKAAPLLCASFVIWLVFWAASRSLAVGLRMREDEPSRRQLLEHLEASAHFLWRRGLIGPSLSAVRDEIVQRARRQTHDFDALDRGGRARALARMTSLSAARIDHAMFADPTNQRAEFTSIIRTLQSIRRQL